MQETGALRSRGLDWLGAAFLCSGTAGLIYQVAWQRLLFSAFGIDLVSVAIIVSAFMLGLGMGALGGGWVGDRWPVQALSIFAVCETGIGLFGVASPHAMRVAASLLSDASLGMTALVNFALVLIPAALMGSTLPVLIAHLVRMRSSVGTATGQLYAVNTFGAMLGALGAGMFMFRYWELDTVIYFAAVLNFAVAASVYLGIGQSADKKVALKENAV